MRHIHFVLQGKGGVGKTFVSALLAQFKRDQGKTILCLDTDPVNATFSGYKSLEVKRIELMEKEEINTRRFDDLIELILTSTVDEIIVDNGASSFVPLSSYLISNNVSQMLKDNGANVCVHTIITGGQALRDTLTGFAYLAKKLGNATEFFIWLNEFWGKIEHEGMPLENMKAYKDHKKYITGILTIPEVKKETFGEDISQMLQNKETFLEAINNEKTLLMAKQRLRITQQNLYQQMGMVMGGG